MKAAAAALHFNTVKSFKGLRTWQMCEHVNTRALVGASHFPPWGRSLVCFITAFLNGVPAPPAHH